MYHTGIMKKCQQSSLHIEQKTVRSLDMNFKKYLRFKFVCFKREEGEQSLYIQNLIVCQVVFSLFTYAKIL